MMRRMLTVLIVLALATWGVAAMGQTVVFSDDFENATAGDPADARALNNALGGTWALTWNDLSAGGTGVIETAPTNGTLGMTGTVDWTQTAGTHNWVNDELYLYEFLFKQGPIWNACGIEMSEAAGFWGFTGFAWGVAGGWWQVFGGSNGYTPGGEINGDGLNPSHGPTRGVMSPTAADLTADGDIAFQVYSLRHDRTVASTFDVWFYANGNLKGEFHAPWNAGAGDLMGFGGANDDAWFADNVMVTEGAATPTPTPTPIPSPTPKPGWGSVLFVVGNAVDVPEKDRLVAERISMIGYSVEYITDALSASSNAPGHVAVVVSESCGSGNVGDKFMSVTQPVVSWEAYHFDNMMWTGPTTGTDLDVLLEGADDSLTIVNDGHPLAAGLTGTVQVYSGSGRISWGVPAAGALKIATPSTDAAKWSIFAYETGALDYAGVAVAGRRVGIFPWGSFTDVITDDGWALFDAAIIWAAPTPTPTPTPTPPPNPLEVIWSDDFNDGAADDLVDGRTANNALGGSLVVDWAASGSPTTATLQVNANNGDSLGMTGTTDWIWTDTDLGLTEGAWYQVDFLFTDGSNWGTWGVEIDPTVPSYWGVTGFTCGVAAGWWQGQGRGLGREINNDGSLPDEGPQRGVMAPTAADRDANGNVVFQIRYRTAARTAGVATPFELVVFANGNWKGQFNVALPGGGNKIGFGGGATNDYFIDDVVFQGFFFVNSTDEAWLLY